MYSYVYRSVHILCVGGRCVFNSNNYRRRGHEFGKEGGNMGEIEGRSGYV